MPDMRRISFYDGPRNKQKILHIETDGCIINIQVGLADAHGRKVTRVNISPEDETRSPDPDGYYWRLADDGVRVIRDPEPGMHDHDTSTDPSLTGNYT